MTARIHSILIAAEHGAPQAAVTNAQLDEGGLVGDRHHGSGVVSLIEREAIDAFNAASSLGVEDARIRRNIVTEGIGLNDLVGKRFTLAGAVLEGTELCEPCATLGNDLATDAVSAPQVVRLLAHSGGLRARVISGGAIGPGDAVTES